MATSRLKIALWNVRLFGPFARVFEEVVPSFEWCFSSLGHRVVILNEPPMTPEDFDYIFVIGANMLPEGTTLPPKTIVLNFEQFPDWRPHLPALYAGHEIWNYDPVVHQRFLSRGLSSVCVPFGWTPALSPFRSIPREPKYDLYFAGWMNDDRSRRVELLRKAGLMVRIGEGHWGTTRAEAIAQSRVVLSMRSFEDSPFMSVRIFPVWTMGMPVLSDGFAGRELHPGIESAMEIVPSQQELAKITAENLRNQHLEAVAKFQEREATQGEQAPTFEPVLLKLPSDNEIFVETALRLCRDPERCQALGAAGLRYAKAHPMLPGVRSAMESLVSK